MTEHMDKAALLDKIRTREAEFESVLALLSEAEMITTGVNGEWSIKDVLAHMTAWQKRTIIRLQAAAEGREPTMTPISNEEEMNALNEQFYQENKARLLSDVLADWRATHLRMLEAVQVLSDEDLNDPHKFAWNDGNALWQYVAGDTYEHIDEHSGSVEQWLARNQ
jgi:hypothetical protein